MGAFLYGAIACAAGCGGDAFTTATGSETSDASTGDRGALDAGPVDAGPGWCASHGTGHTFCEDFLAGVPDQLVAVALNGTLVADTTDYESPPQSMTASVPALLKGTSGTAFGSHDLSKATGTQFEVSAYYKVASTCFPEAGQENAVSLLALDFPDTSYELVVALLPTSVELIEVTSDPDGGNTKVQPMSIQATNLVDSWQDFTLSVDGGGALAGKTATLTVGNATFFDKVALKNAPTVAFLQHPLVYFGLASKNDGSDTAPACRVGVDDILVDVHAVTTSATSVEVPGSR
jgi:hypothetical protein